MACCPPVGSPYPGPVDLGSPSSGAAMADMTIPKDWPDDRIWHVVPMNDTREHVHEGRAAAKGQCWCCPTIDVEDDGYIVIHNAMDCREDYEIGRRAPH